MEIPTKEVIKNLCLLCTRSNESTLVETIATINAQAREIRELQATICRLKEERVADMIAGDIELEKNDG